MNKVKLLHAEILKRRPIDDETFAAGLVRYGADGSIRVEFLRYRKTGGIAGRIGAREMAAIAPDLVRALKADGAELKRYLTDSDGPTPPPGGLGSSAGTFLYTHYRQDRENGDCNGKTRSRYAHGPIQNTPRNAVAGPCRTGVSVAGNVPKVDLVAQNAPNGALVEGG